jgi:hypothetical protein
VKEGLETPEALKKKVYFTEIGPWQEAKTLKEGVWLPVYMWVFFIKCKTFERLRKKCLGVETGLVLAVPNFHTQKLERSTSCY